MTIDRPTIGYDSQCRVCQRCARRFGPWLRQRGFAVRPLQDRDLSEALGLAPGALPEEFQLLRPGRPAVGGAIAIAAIAVRLGLLPVVWLAAMPVLMRLMRRCYHRLAAGRNCRQGGCLRHGHRPVPVAHAAWIEVFASRLLAGLNGDRRRAAL